MISSSLFVTGYFKPAIENTGGDSGATVWVKKSQERGYLAGVSSRSLLKTECFLWSPGWPRRSGKSEQSTKISINSLSPHMPVFYDLFVARSELKLQFVWLFECCQLLKINFVTFKVIVNIERIYLRWEFLIALKLEETSW